MIQRIQFTGLSNTKSMAKNNANISASKGVSNVSFKRTGRDLYEETVSLIDEVREKAQRYNVKKLKGRHEDGSIVEVEAMKKGIFMCVENRSPEFVRRYNTRSVNIETKFDQCTWYSPTASFMIRELDEGTVDAVIQKYLPTVL